ncbi:gag/pol polyprotein [Tanacetum coccineum]
MHGDETPDAYLNRAQEYADALAAIGEPVKDKDLVMLAVSVLGLHEEYNGLKTTITARQALADTVAELTWLQALLHELGIRSSSTPILRCNNLGATYLSANPIFRARTKHVEIDYHFVREKVAQGDLRVQHISTHDQIADIFTKPLPTPSRFLLDAGCCPYLPYRGVLEQTR